MKYAAAALLAFFVGCSTPSNPETDHYWYSSFHGTKARDPVSGRLVDTRWAETRDYNNITFFFENHENAILFDSNPERYGSYRNPYYYILPTSPSGNK